MHLKSLSLTDWVLHEKKSRKVGLPAHLWVFLRVSRCTGNLWTYRCRMELYIVLVGAEAHIKDLSVLYFIFISVCLVDAPYISLAVAAFDSPSKLKQQITAILVAFIEWLISCARIIHNKWAGVPEMWLSTPILNNLFFKKWFWVEKCIKVILHIQAVKSLSNPPPGFGPGSPPLLCLCPSCMFSSSLLPL